MRRHDNLPLPWISCLWCDYKDKVARDLEYHFLEKHKDRLYKMKVTREIILRDSTWTKDPFYWMYGTLEYRLYKAIYLTKRKSDFKEHVSKRENKIGG
jgi:hypothetical protein